MIWFANQPVGTGFVEVLIMVFLLLTAPPSANMMAKAAMHMEVPKVSNTRGDPWQQ
jgi:multicomponent K+:H+ antiporter subunit G